MAERERYAFKWEFEPVADTGDTILLMPIGKYYRIIYLEGIPSIDIDFGSFTGGQTKENQELTMLYMNKDELAQYRFVPIDPVTITQLKQPKTPKWLTRNTSGQLPNSNNYISAITGTLNLTEIFQFEDTKLYADVYAPAATTTSRVRFYGFRYMLEETTAPPIRVPVIWYESRAPRG